MQHHQKSEFDLRFFSFQKKMEDKKTIDKQTFGESSSPSNPSISSGVICSNCKTKITDDDYMNHIFTCKAHSGEIGIQTTMGK